MRQRFTVLADESKVLAHSKPVLMKLSEADLKPAVVGHNTRTMDYPLQVHDIVPVSSHACREVQFADLLAGAACSLVKKEVAEPNTFENQIAKELTDKKLVCDALLPSSKLSPEELGAGKDSDTQTNLVDYATRILSNDPAVRM